MATDVVAGLAGARRYRAGGFARADGQADREVLVRLVVVVAVGIVAVLVGTQFGWNFVFAPLLGYAFIRWAIGSLRAMTGDDKAQRALDQPQPVPVEPEERIVYRCADCGTEVVEVTRGTGKAPRHCATPMEVRAEIPRT